MKVLLLTGQGRRGSRRVQSQRWLPSPLFVNDADSQQATPNWLAPRLAATRVRAGRVRSRSFRRSIDISSGSKLITVHHFHAKTDNANEKYMK